MVEKENPEKFVVVEGKVKWFRMREGQENKYGKLTVSFYPDEASRKKIQGLRLKNGLREDDDGFFFKFYLDPRKNALPKIINKKGEPVTALIGNGSAVKMQLELFTWIRPDGSAGIGAIPKAFMISNLVHYEPPSKTPEVKKTLDDGDKLIDDFPI